MQSINEQVNTLATINEEFENYFANTIVPQLFVDSGLILRKFTPSAMKQFNLKDEYVGKPIEEIRGNFRYPTIIDNIQSVIKSGNILEKEIQTNDMSWYQMNILPYIIRKENKVNGVIITFVDITPRIKDLKEQEKLVAEYELLLDTIAHDIKNPLHSLGLLFEMIKKGTKQKPEELPTLLGYVDSSLSTMKKVINDLIDARWQNHRYHADQELLDFGNILEDVKLSLSSQLKDSAAIIKEELEVTQITFVRRQLRSIIYNLVNNSLKYADTSRKPEIIITVSSQNDQVVISVMDNGIGISEGNQKKIFDKFSRGDSFQEGSGVGLYLVYTMVTNAGGKIEVKSELGKGSTFTIICPNVIVFV
jgi:two-component system phosphate regulon sensor histidine kinase PhoR